MTTRADYLERAASYDAEAESLYRRIDRVREANARGEHDPEDRDATRDWRQRAWHCEDRAAECRRWADRAESQTAKENR